MIAAMEPEQELVMAAELALEMEEALAADLVVVVDLEAAMLEELRIPMETV